MSYGPWTEGLDHAERIGRCRCLRALCLLLLGASHPLVTLLADAETDDAALDEAKAELDRLPALRRRRLLASYAELARPARAS